MARITGCGRPPGLGGVTTQISSTPATCAGTAGHQQGRQQRGLPSGDAEADAAQRQDPLAEDDAVPVLEEPGVAQLAAVKRPDVRGRL